MRTFMIYIDGRRIYRRMHEKKLRRWMYDHIRNELAKGRKLSQIEFCYTPVC